MLNNSALGDKQAKNRIFAVYALLSFSNGYAHAGYTLFLQNITDNTREKTVCLQLK